MNNAIAVTRTHYGEINAHGNDDLKALVATALKLASLAESRKKIPVAKDTLAWERISSSKGNKRIGDATYHEIYDVTPDGRKALICVRMVEGTKYGIKTLEKTYYLLTQHGKGVRVVEANKAKAAKAAKSTTVLGQAIDICENKSPLILPKSVARTGYAILCRNKTGDLISPLNDEPWPMGKALIDSASEDGLHGLIYYKELEHAITAGRNGEKDKSRNSQVVVNVEVSGNEFGLSDNAYTVTKMKPIGVVPEIEHQSNSLTNF